jgi:tape measure domain-containing protein
MNKKLDGIFARSFDGLKGSVAAIGAALGVDQLRRMTDTWTDLTSRVNLAAGSIDKGAEVMGRLGEMARRTYSDLTQTAESYLGNATAVKELGYSTDQTLDYTEALNNALVVSGAKGDRAASVIDALSKAMALGKLSGDNLNTVISTGGRVAEALAAGLGTTVNGLRKLGAQGKITGQDIVKGLSSQMEVLRKEAADMPATIGDGFTLLNNALLEYVGNGDQATGVSAKIAEALIVIADNFDKVADAGLQVAAVIAGALIGRSISTMIRNLSLGASALISFARALNTVRTTGGLATALGGIGAAAGPVGMIIGGAVVGSLALYSANAADASNRSQKFEKDLEALGLLAPKVASGIQEAANAIDNVGKSNASQKIRSIADELDRIRNGGNFGSVGDELSAIAGSARSGGVIRLFDDEADSKARKVIIELTSSLQNMQITTDKVRDRMNEIRKTPISDTVKEMADDLDRTAQKIVALQAQSMSLGIMPGMQEAHDEINNVINDLDRLEKREIITSQQRKNLEDALIKLRDTGEGADEARKALASIDGISFSTTLMGLDALIGKVATLFAQADLANKALGLANGQGSSSFSRGGRVRAREELLEERRLDKEYIENAKKKALLGKEQYAIETKIAQIKAQAEKDGRKLTGAQIREIAAAQVAGDKARTDEGKKPKKEKAVQKSTDQKIDSDIQAIKDRTAALQAEAQMVGLSYQEQEKRRIALDLEQAALAKLRDEAIKKGQTDLSNIKISPEQRAQIDEVSAAYARQAEELRKVQEVQDRADQAASDFYDTFRSSMVGAIQGANSLADALKNILGRLSELLLNSAFNALFMPSSGGTGGGMFGGAFNWIGGLIGSGFSSRSSDPWSGLRLAGGGHVRGPGGPRTDSIPANLSNGEFVVNAKATKQNRGLLEAINKGKTLSMAKGGLVSLTAPTLPSLRSTAASQQSQAGGIADVRVFMDRDGNWKAEVERISQRSVKQGLVTYEKGSTVRTARDLRQVSSRGMAK